MFEEEVYRCTKELWGLIPSIENPGKTALDDHNKHWNECRVDTKVRLIFDGVRKDDGLHLGLSKADMLNMAKLMMMPEWMLGEKKISDMFTPEMFRSNFWYMWRTTFAFHQWHSAVELKRYMHLFYHTMPHFHDMTPVQRTKYTNFHSFMLPALNLLEDKGVHIHYQSKIADAGFTKANGKKRITRLHIERRNGEKLTIDVSEHDVVFLTLGTRPGNIPNFRWEEAAPSVKRGRRSGNRGEGRNVPPLSLSPRPRRFQAHLGRGPCVGPESPARGIASAGRVRIYDLLIVLDRSHGRARRPGSTASGGEGSFRSPGRRRSG